MGCGGSKPAEQGTREEIEQPQPAASNTLLDPAAGKPAFDLTNGNEIKATLAKMTVEQLSTLMKEWSPEVRSKLEAGLEAESVKSAPAFDLTNGTEIKGALSKLTVDELTSLMREWSPEVRNKLGAGLEVEAKLQAEKASAKQSAPADAENSQQASDTAVAEVDNTSKSVCCC